MMTSRRAAVTRALAALVLMCVCVSSSSALASGEPELSLWATGDSVKIAPAAPAEARNHHWDGGARRISLAGARGETVAFQVILRAQGDLEAVSVAVSELKSRRGRIPRAAVSLFREFYVKLTPDSKHMARRWIKAGEYPDALIPFNDPYDAARKPVGAPFAMSPERNQPVWVDVRIPRDAAPGAYEADLVATVAGRKAGATAAKLRLVVWDFELPKEWKLDAAMDFYWTNFTRGEGLPGGSGYSEEKDRVARRYDLMAYGHGFWNMHWWPSPRTAYDAQGRLTRADWSAYDRYFGDILSGRLLGVKPTIWKMPVPEYRFFKPKQLSDPAAIAAAYRDYSKEMAAHFQQRGWKVPLEYVYTIDEPGNWFKGSKETITGIADAVRKGSGDRFKVFIPHGDTIGAGHVNFWAIYPSNYKPAKMKVRQAAGDVVWFYQGCHEWQGLPVMYIPDYALAMRLWPWIAWKYDVDGIFSWASNMWGSTPYTDNQAADDPRWGPGNGKFYYPGRLLTQIGAPAIKGPVGSIRMKMWRRGMQDYQYFWMLKAKGQESAVDAVVNRLVRKALAEGELDWNKDLVNGGWYDYEGNWSKKPLDYYRARAEMGGALAALYRGSSKSAPANGGKGAPAARKSGTRGASNPKAAMNAKAAKLFRSAREAERRRMDRMARQLYERLIETYPGSELADEARARLGR